MLLTDNNIMRAYGFTIFTICCSSDISIILKYYRYNISPVITIQYIYNIVIYIIDILYCYNWTIKFDFRKKGFQRIAAELFATQYMITLTARKI